MDDATMTSPANVEVFAIKLPDETTRHFDNRAIWETRMIDLSNAPGMGPELLELNRAAILGSPRLREHFAGLGCDVELGRAHEI